MTADRLPRRGGTPRRIFRTPVAPLPPPGNPTNPPPTIHFGPADDRRPAMLPGDAAEDAGALRALADSYEVGSREGLARHGRRQRKAAEHACKSALTVVRQSARMLAFEGLNTKGVHLNQALELSHETGPPHIPLLMVMSTVLFSGKSTISTSQGARRRSSGSRCATAC